MGQRDADGVGRGAQESGVGGLSGDATEGRGNTGKATSAAADEAGAGSRQGQRPGLRGGVTIQQENPNGESSGVGGGEGGCEASIVARESSGVKDEEGGCKASGLAENSRVYPKGVQGGVKLSQGIDTPGVAELPRGDETPGVTTGGKDEPREDEWGQGGGENPPTIRATG